MEAQAIAKHIRFSAQKGRLMADLIRGLPVSKALDELGFSRKRAAPVLKKVLESAVANAEHNQGADIDELKVSAVYVDGGPVFRRHRARARGRVNEIQKHTCHITVKVSDELGEKA